MKRWRVSILSLGVIVLSTLFGCRVVEHYLYKDIEMPFFNGVLYIEVSATPQDYDVDNKRITKYAEPYSLGFRFKTKKSESLRKLRISNITLEGQKSGSVMPLLAREKFYKDYSAAYEDSDIKGIFVMVGYEAETLNWSYEPYILKARIQIHRDNNEIDEQEIEILLEPNFKKSRRSDVFDSIMSV